MNKKPILTRLDYEDFLICLYFGQEHDYLLNCINRAYLDFNRTLHGLGDLASKNALYEHACSNLKQLFGDLQNGKIHVTNQIGFDSWHRAACQRLTAIYIEHGYTQLFVGQAQKWLNMTFKYIFTMGEQRLQGFGDVYQFCHVPLDNVLIEQLTKYGFPKLPCAWSRLNNYDKYLEYQQWIRQRFDRVPLDIEFLLWLGKDINTKSSV